MPILASDVKWYGSAVMPDDDSATAIGGAIDTSKKVEFGDSGPMAPFGLAQLVSSTSVDTTQQVTVSYRNQATPTLVLTEVRTLNGLTPVVFGANWDRALKGVKNAITLGDVAVESQVAIATGTAQAGDVDNITVPTAAGIAIGQVIRLTGGTGVNQIREIITVTVNGGSTVLQVSYAWATIPGATTTYRISKGMVFEKSPFEIFTVRRPFFNSAADVPGGATRTYFEKVFARNMHATLTLQSTFVREQADLTGESTFGIASTTSDAGTNGVGNNRQVAPSAITFDNNDKNVPGGNLGPGNVIGAGTTSFIGVWLKLTRQPGDASLNQPVTMRLNGQTV